MDHQGHREGYQGQVVYFTNSTHGDTPLLRVVLSHSLLYEEKLHSSDVLTECFRSQLQTDNHDRLLTSTSVAYSCSLAHLSLCSCIVFRPCQGVGLPHNGEFVKEAMWLCVKSGFTVL